MALRLLLQIRIHQVDQWVLGRARHLYRYALQHLSDLLLIRISAFEYRLNLQLHSPGSCSEVLSKPAAFSATKRLSAIRFDEFGEVAISMEKFLPASNFERPLSISPNR